MQRHLLALLLALLGVVPAWAQPDWPAIKAGARFYVADTAYAAPYLQPLQVPGWEDGLYLTRDGRQLYSTYLPVDALSWITALQRNPICFDFHPYFRPPLVGVDTLTNPFGCRNYMNSDIIRSTRPDTGQPFAAWAPSGLRTPALFDGGAQGVLANPDTFDVFVFTRDSGGPAHTDIMLAHRMPVAGQAAGAVPILSTPAQEDNPHIERLPNGDLILLFDRDRSIYYSLSQDDGRTWQTPTRITRVLNDQAPYDVQPHLWHDGQAWWVYFCADSPTGTRGIYKSRQQTPDDWDSWGTKELVIEGDGIQGAAGAIYGIGEPTLTAWGDLSFVVVYGDAASPDSTDRLDCDTWLLPRRHPLPVAALAPPVALPSLRLVPNPATHAVQILVPEGWALAPVLIRNVLGEIVQEQPLPVDGILDLQSLSPGIYTVQVGRLRSTLVRQ